jgi:hypothetical protein
MSKDCDDVKRIIYVFLIFLFCVTTVTFLVNVNQNKEYINYTEETSLNYSVCLKEETYYENKCQPMGRSYVTNHIENILIDFGYEFNIDYEDDYNYEYTLDAIMTVYDRNNKGYILDTKTENLLSAQTGEISNKKGFVLKRNIEINYQKYNDWATSFKSSSNVSIDGDLKILFSVKTTNSSSVKVETKTELVIPLLESTITLSANGQKDNNKTNRIEIDTKNSSNYNFILSAISIIMVCIFTSLLALDILSERKKYSLYERKIKSLLKNYDRMIVSSNGLVKIDEKDYLEIIDVNRFKELVDIADRSLKLITWTEIKHNNGLTVSWFSIEDGKRLYRIIYNSSDTEFK